MNIRRYIVVGSVMLALLMIPDTVAQELQPANPRGSTATVAPDGGIIVDGKYFESWQAYWQSDFFRDAGMRCGTVLGEGPPTRDASDCDLNYTDPAFIYSPFLMRYRIPVVVHVIRADDGVTGHITPELVQSQIDVLNEDCRAIAGTNGANGTDVEIEFYLATTDPDGNPTSGITYSDNTDWFNDTGNYWDSLAWDPHNYLNIYTNMAGGGAYANIPQAPALGDIGSNADRIVILWSVFGRPGAAGPPYDLGRTATHEVGHYLGLYHPFQGGCQDPNTPNCHSNGDCICDTNPDQEATFLCPTGATSCDGYLIPIENYMEYTNDACMEEFTPEQARRMRCTLEFWRPDLFEPMTIWADFCYSGSQDGSYDRPFNTLTQALVEVPFGGTIKMKPSSTAETPVINQAVTLEAFEGSVVIGQ